MLVEGAEDAIKKFIVLSSLDEKIDRFSAGIIGNIENAQSTMPTAVFEKYKDVVMRFFDPLTLKENVREIILQRHDEQKMRGAVGFLKHPQVALMAQKEESAKSPQAVQAMQNFFASLQVSPPAKKRKRLIESIDRVKRSSSFVVDRQVELFQAITWGMRGLNSDDQKITTEQMKQIVLDMKAQLIKQMEPQVWMSMLFAYKDVSDNDLEAYIALHETIEGTVTTEFIQLVYSDVHQQEVGRLQQALEAEFV